MKKILLFSILTLGHIVHGQMGELVGVVKDDRGEPRPFVKVIVSKSDSAKPEFVAGADADFDGHFRITSMQAGIYDVEITDYDSDTVRLSAVEVKENHVTFLGTIEIAIDLESLPRIPSVPSPIREIEVDPFGRAIKINPEDIRRP